MRPSSRVACWGVSKQSSAAFPRVVGPNDSTYCSTICWVPEWEALGERGRAHMPQDRQLVFLGFMLLGATAAERMKFLAEMPLPARLAWRLLGRRAFGKEYREIYGQDPIW